MIETSTAERIMRRALDLAARGPMRNRNPRVGAVIVDATGRILAEGWHRGHGTAHAEVAALDALPVSLRTPAALADATMVVTLEPCDHTGTTGPCSVAILESGIRSVVHAIADPSPTAAGGAERLRAAGVAVRSGFLAAEAAELNRGWLTVAALGRPFVTAKWASTLDGRVAAADGSSRWITGADARVDVHRRRADAAAILVGTGTVLADDPSLTARDAAGGLLATQPIPVVLGARGIPAEAAVHGHPHAPLFLDGHDLPATLATLAEAGLHEVFVEGGPTIVTALAAAGLVDEYLVYLAPVLLGGPRLAVGDLGIGSIADARRLAVREITRLGDDLLVVARPQASPETSTSSEGSSHVHGDH